MATGAYDANGVWIYGPDDLFGPHPHTLLNKLASAVSAIIGVINAKAILQLTSNLSLVNGTTTAITFDSTDLANTLGGAFTITHSTGLLVCVTAGTYKFDAEVTFASNTTGTRLAGIQKALAATPTTFGFDRSVQIATAVSAIVQQVQARSYLTCAVGDVVRVVGMQSSGGALNVSGAHLEIKKVA